MTIGIDARMLGPQTGGIGRYTEQLVRQLLTIDTGDQYVLFLRKGNWDCIDDHPRIKKVLADIQWYSLKEQTSFHRIIASEQIDLMHFPHWNVPLSYNAPFVVTIHDLIMFHYPRPEATTLGPLMYRLKDGAHRVIVKHAAKKALAIITPTQWVKEDVAKTFRISREKIHVTYEAPLPPLPKEAQDTAIVGEHRIQKPYGIYVGSGYPHENLERLIEVWDDARQLVLVGSTNRFYKRLQTSVKDRPQIVFTGFVSDEALAALYAHADLCVFPSLSEGFGLPPIEAMQYGIPVVSSNASCMPEVYGEAALYFDPHSGRQMRAVIEQGFIDTEIRSELMIRAREELKRYSWKRMAEETSALYNEYQK